MKLHLILLTSLFRLSNGFEVTLRGELTEEPCSGEEHLDFDRCVMKGVAEDPSLADHVWTEVGGGFTMNRGSVRKLQTASPCGACDGTEPPNHFCITYCKADQRRLSEDGTDLVAVYKDGKYEGNSEATEIAKVIIDCLGDSDVSANDPCLPDTAKMSLKVTL
jgi:hypothetical protein